MTEDHQQPACTQQKKCGLHSCLYCGWKPVTDADRIEDLRAELKWLYARIEKYKRALGLEIRGKQP
jgi:hypothetical protein